MQIQRYLGNDRLKAKGVQLNFEQWQIDEYIKCASNYLYFIENYNFIQMLDNEELTLIKLRDYQKRLLETVDQNRFTIGKLPRQVGKSTSVAMYIVWCIIFKDNYSVGIAADKSDTAKEIMDRIKTAYENLPLWIQQGVEAWNVKSIELENGSRVIVSTTTPKTFRGQSHNMILLDEFAHVERNIADPFFTSIYPVITSGTKTKMVIISTPKGMNHFHKLWNEATEGKSTFKPVEIKWNEVPGRDEKFKKETISNVGFDRWQQEFECVFIGGTNTLISTSKLSELTYINPISKSEDVLYYKKPEIGRNYFISVDVSEGKGQDYQAFTVIDITQRPFEVVCLYRSKYMPSLLLPEIIYRIGNLYNEAAVLVETKSEGGQVADILFHDLEYENLLGAEKRGRSGQVLTNYKTRAKGLSTSAQSKAIGCSTFKLLMETDQLLINSEEIYNEVQNFVLNGISYSASTGTHDDLVMTLVNFSWATTQAFFQNFTESGNIRDVFKEKIQELEDDLVPFGFILDGNEEDENPFF